MRAPDCGWVFSSSLELIGQASVRSILCEGSDIPPFPDEVEDMAVAHMVSLIREGFPFEINTWCGGVKAIDAKQWKSGYGADGLGDSGGEHGQPSNTDVMEEEVSLGLRWIYQISCVVWQMNYRHVQGPC
ncbi:hypothetical protein F2Q68_00007837 [Brassica cretica]|uniref:Uncharacterized protein n=1 Tax=Brassica cretica TaxID=69181 RepID=A0A8S9KVH6_BRACR|nr:hypothetical protein F2Q68_00007837 [Brassica cretica]